jgi:hypothetical protein
MDRDRTITQAELAEIILLALSHVRRVEINGEAVSGGGMKDMRTIGERIRSHQRWTRAVHKPGGGPRLVVDNDCPLPPKRDPARGIKGIRTIHNNGGDDHGPEAA